MPRDIPVLLLIPPICALIGWLTNLIAVQMIFRPRRPISFLGLTLVGVIPKRKSDLAQKIGETVEKELISHHDVHDAVDTPGFREEILDAVIAAIDRFIEKTLGGNPIVSVVLAGDVAMKVKEIVKDEVRGVLPGIMEDLFEKMERRLDFKEIVRRKIEEYDLAHLEEIIYAIAARELRFIEVLGGILGFLVGLAQVALLLALRGSAAGVPY